MYVCLCRGITDRQIRHLVDQGAASMRELRQKLGVCSQCGKCGEHAKALLDEARLGEPLRALQTPSGRLAGVGQAVVLPATG